MKVKLSLDKNAIQAFFLEHVEKIVFGGIAVCFAMLVYGAAMRESYDRQPQQLLDQVKNTREHIERTPPEQDGVAKPPDYTQLVADVRNPIPPDNYPMPNPLVPQIFPSQAKRLKPPLYAVSKLRGAADRGALALSGGSGRPGAAGGAGATAGGAAGQRWVVLTGVVPYADQRLAYAQTFASAEYQGPDGDMPRYALCVVQRADVTRRPPGGELEWVTLDVQAARRRASGWAQAGDVIPSEFLHESLVFPLAPRVDKPWGPEVAHEEIVGPPFEAVWRNPAAYRGKKVSWQGTLDSAVGLRAVFVWGERIGTAPAVAGDVKYFAIDYPSEDAARAFQVGRGGTITGVVQGQVEITINRQDPTSGAIAAVPVRVPLLKPVSETEEEVGPAPVDDPFPFGDPLAGPAAPTRRPAPEARPRAPREPGVPENLLFRFFDFDVEPGAKYRYRVRLVLHDPNFGVPERFLHKELIEERRSKEAALDQARTELAQAQATGNALLIAEKTAQVREWTIALRGIESGWSNETDVISVPRDTRLLALSVAPALRITSDPSAQIMIVKWLEASGMEAYDRFSVQRGMTANYPGRMFPPRSEAKPAPGGAGAFAGGGVALPGGAAAAAAPSGVPVDYLTETLIVDMRGGGRLPGRDRTVTEPGEILILDVDGTLRLLDETEDLTEVQRHTLGIDPDAEGPTTPAQPGPGPTDTESFGTGGHEGRDFDDFRR